MGDSRRQPEVLVDFGERVVESEQLRLLVLVARLGLGNDVREQKLEHRFRVERVLFQQGPQWLVLDFPARELCRFVSAERELVFESAERMQLLGESHECHQAVLAQRQQFLERQGPDVYSLVPEVFYLFWV